MMNLEQIRNIRFHTARRDGYMPAEVDSFIENVVSAFEAVLAERNAEKNHLEEVEKELAACRARERSVGEALLIAQHQASLITSEAQSRSELMIEEAKAQAKTIVDSVASAKTEREAVMAELRQEVTEFKGRLLQLYKEHLTLIDSMPEYHDEEEPEETSAAAEADATEAAPAQPEHAAESAEEMPVIASHSEPEAAAETAQAEESSDIAAELEEERFAGLQFGTDYEDPSDDGFFQRKK